MASYTPAVGGQQGDASLGGAIAGLVGSNQDRLRQEFYSNLLGSKYNRYLGSFFRPHELQDLFKQYGAAYEANTPAAGANAQYYADLARGILSDSTKPEDIYSTLRSGNLSALGDYFKNIASFNTAALKGREVAGGLGNTSGSSYDRILNNTITSANIAPVLNNIFSSLGPTTSALYGAGKNWDQYRLGAFSADPLTGYLDAASAGRVINPFLTRQAVVGSDLGNLSRIGEGIRANTSGFTVVPGLGTKLNNLMGSARNALSFTGDLMGTFGGGAGGMGGGMGGMGGGGGMGGMGGMNMQQLAPFIQQMMQQYGANPTVSYNPAAAYSNPYSGGIDTPYSGDTYLNSPALAYA